MDEALNLVTVRYRYSLRGEEVDALHRGALRTDRLCVRLDLGFQLVALERAGEYHNVWRRQGQEAFGEPQTASEIGVKGFEVATLITAGGHRAGRRQDVADEPGSG